MRPTLAVTALALFIVSSSSSHIPLNAAEATATLAVPGRANSTPWVATDGDFVAVAWGARAASGATDVFVAVSRDSGATFSAPVQVNGRPGDARLGGEMPPRVSLSKAVDRRSPDLVVLWTARAEGRTEIRIARSSDGGATFAPSAAMQAAAAAGDRGWPALTVDARGVAHAIWLDHRGMAQPEGAHQHAGHDSAAAPAQRDGVAMAQKSGLYYGSTASGSTERELVKGVCYCCKTAISTGSAGQLFLAWRQVYPGNIRDIAFAQSLDNGATFSAPARISRDDWQLDGCPDDGPAMVVDRSNVVHVVWPTVIGGATPVGALFYASTRDGKSFTTRQRIPTLGAPKPSHPQIAIDAQGQLYVAWDESVNSVRTAAMRTLRIGDNGKPVFGDAQTISLAGVSSTYPMMAATSKGLLAVWTSGVSEQSVIKVRTVTPAPASTAR